MKPATQMIYFDTLQYVKTLEAAGVSSKQAEAMAKVQQKVLSECLDSTLATKEDIHLLEKATKEDISSLRESTKEDINSLRESTKEDISSLRESTKEDISSLRESTKENINSLRNELVTLENKLMGQIGPIKTDIKWIRCGLGLVTTGVGTLILKAFF